MSEAETLPDQPAIACEQCPYTTTDVRAGMDHARTYPGHAISGPGRIEGTTLRISTEAEEDDDEDWGDDG